MRHLIIVSKANLVLITTKLRMLSNKMKITRMSNTQTLKTTMTIITTTRTQICKIQSSMKMRTSLLMAKSPSFPSKQTLKTTHLRQLLSNRIKTLSLETLLRVLITNLARNRLILLNHLNKLIIVYRRDSNSITNL